MRISLKIMLLSGVTMLPFMIGIMAGYHGIIGIEHVALSGADELVPVSDTEPEVERSEATAKLDEFAARILSASGASLKTLLVCAIIAMLLTSQACLLVTRSIIRPIMRIMTVLQAAEAGDYSQRVESYSHDEFGVMASSVNRLMDRLEDERGASQSDAEYVAATAGAEAEF